MHIQSFKGLTLTELLIATGMIGVVMLGMVSVDYATRKSQITSSRSTHLAMRLGAMMIHITRNCSLAIGDNANSGIRILDTGPVDSRYLCVRQDLAGSPDNYGDDTWMCYTKRSNGNIYWCTPGTWIACPAVAANNLGAAQTLTYTYVPDPNPAVLDNYCEITITSLYDNTQPFHTVDNPSYTLTSRIQPIGQTNTYVP